MSGPSFSTAKPHCWDHTPFWVLLVNAAILQHQVLVITVSSFSFPLHLLPSSLSFTCSIFFLPLPLLLSIPPLFHLSLDSLLPPAPLSSPHTLFFLPSSPHKGHRDVEEVEMVLVLDEDHQCHNRRCPEKREQNTHDTTSAGEDIASNTPDILGTSTINRPWSFTYKSVDISAQMNRCLNKRLCFCWINNFGLSSLGLNKGLRKVE